jgi:putative heme-binding domain-containing protein
MALALCASAAGAQAPLHDEQYPEADIKYGATVYTARCVTCHGAQGDAIANVDLRAGRFKTAVIDRDLERVIRSGTPAGMPAFVLDNAEMTGVIAYIRNMNAVDAATVAAGDAARGRDVYQGKGGCAACHRVGPTGSHVAPNLSEVGATRSPAQIERSLLDPSSQMMPINRPVRIVTKDGTVIQGRRLNEDTYGVQIMDDHERLHSLVKADLREYTIGTTSSMPSFKGKLSSAEIADVVTYLLSLKGQ